MWKRCESARYLKAQAASCVISSCPHPTSFTLTVFLLLDQVKYNKDMFEIEMDATRPVARFFLQVSPFLPRARPSSCILTLFSVQVYLKTGVFPPRQKIIGAR